jgi:hypothetical protein
MGQFPLGVFERHLLAVIAEDSDGEPPLTIDLPPVGVPVLG